MTQKKRKKRTLKPEFLRWVYENWDSHEDCRIRLSLGDSWENLWGKVISPETPRLIGLSNDPLNRAYRWMDIVVETESGDPTLLHRRWNTVQWFQYQEPASRPENFAFRRKLFDTSQAHPGTRLTFWSPGRAFFSFEETLSPEEAIAKIREILGSLTSVSPL